MVRGPCVCLSCTLVYVRMYVSVFALCVTCGQVSFLSVSWFVICCQDGCSTAFANGALPEEFLSHNFDEQCL